MKTDNVQAILRRAIDRKPQEVPVTKLKIDPMRNVREPDISLWKIEGIADDIELNGQMEPAVVEKVGEEYFPLRGFRRATAVKFLADSKKVNPLTKKPFDALIAFVIEEPLTEKDRTAILHDGGNTLPLSAVGVLNMIARMDRVSSTDAEIAIACRGLLDMHYPLTREVKDDAEYANYRRGILQNHLRAIRGPVVLLEAFKAKLRGEQKWPKADEVQRLYQEYQRVIAADKTKKLSQQNPGAEWMGIWEEYKKAKTSTETGRKTAAIVAFNRDNMKTMADKAKSRTLRILEACHLRQVTDPEATILALDDLLVDMEKGEVKPKEIEETLDDLMEQEPTPVAKKPAAAAVA